jgi:hypothetical protein
MFANLGLDYDVDFLGAGAAADAIKARLAGGVPTLFYLWSPHALNAQYILNRIQLPAYSAEGFELGLTDYPVDVLEKVGSKRLSELTPDVAKLYSRFQMDNSAQESMLMQLDGHGQSAAQAVCAWVRKEANAAIWQAWIPNEEFTCSFGQIENKSECIECPAGSGSLGGSQTECELCAAGNPQPTRVHVLPCQDHLAISRWAKPHRFFSAACGAVCLRELRRPRRLLPRESWANGM